MRKSKFGINYLTRGILVLGGLVMVFPFFWMVSSSLKNSVEAFATPPTLIPKAATLINYHHVVQNLDLPRLFLNSVSVSVTVTIIQVLTSAMAGYAFARLHFR